MKVFETIHKVPRVKNQLGGGHGQNNIDLDIALDNIIHVLTSNCSSLFFDHPTIEWSDMSSNTLAKTRTFFYKHENVWRPNGHFQVYVNPSVSWWNGECSDIPYGTHDMKSVLLHEVLHGVGFMSTVDENKGVFPTPYDLLLQDAQHQSLIHGQSYTGSFGQAVYIEGHRIFNPGTFDSGSSFSHLDSNYRIMSSSIPHQMCRRTLDPDTAAVMGKLGYDCTYGQHTNTHVPPFAALLADSKIIICICAGIMVLIAILSYACCCRHTGRRRRKLNESLLDNAL